MEELSDKAESTFTSPLKAIPFGEENKGRVGKDLNVLSPALVPEGALLLSPHVHHQYPTKVPRTN
jgi:hypothetical protein